MPFFSVVIPCYNSKKSIVKCLDSLVNQTFKDFEVILIDDYSQDGTYEFLKKYVKTINLKVVLLKNNENLGPAFSRNKGIIASQSEYIAFCDSDDWYEFNYLYLMHEATSKNNADIVFSNSSRVFANGKNKFLNNISGIPKSGSMKEVLVTGVDSLGSMIIKRNIITECKIPHLRNGEDMAVIPVLISRSKQFGFVEESIYNYYYSGKSLSTVVSPQVIESLLISFNFIEENLPPNLNNEREFIGVRNVLYGALLNTFKLNYQSKKAEQIITDFEKKYPSWHANQYLHLLPKQKRMFLMLIKKRMYFGAWIMSKMHTLLLKLSVV